MRAFDRSQMTPPEILFSKEMEERRAKINDYIASVNDKGGQRRAPYWRDVFEDLRFTNDVARNFGEVCAYCERPAQSGEGLTHHHRPPALAAQRNGSTALLNYVWLTYEWENLLWVCNSCARRKENRFYAKQPTHETNLDIARLRKTEGELFLDPCFHAPHDHLMFSTTGEVVATDKSRAGKETIELFRLNDPDLVAGRHKTALELTAILRNPRRAGAEPAFEGMQGASGWLFADRPRREKKRQFIPFIGAATLMLLQWANQRGLQGESCIVFLEQLNSMNPAERQEILDEFEREITDSDQLKDSTEAEMITVDTSRAQRSTRRRGVEPFSLTESAFAEARLKSISIRNFKALKAVEMQLPTHVEDSRAIPCAVILGENATGKSSVLEAMTLALLGTEGIDQLHTALKDENLTPAEMLHRPNPEDWDVVTSEPLEIVLSYHDHDETTRLTAQTKRSGFGGQQRPAKVLLAYGPRRYFSKRKTRRFRAPHFRVRSLFDPLATIPNPIDWLLTCNEPAFNAAVRAMREVLVLDDTSDVLRDHEHRRVLIHTDSGLTPLANLSEGYKSVVAMAADIIRELLIHYDNLENAHAVVLIDEIETHLHPRWKMQIVERLRRAFPRVQFIVTTHDPLCLRGMFDGEVFVLHRHPENQRIETISDLPDVRGMRAEQLLTSEFFGLGSTDPETDARLKRYEILSSKQNRTPEENRERGDLHDLLSETMVIGDTLRDQLLNEAVSKSKLDPFAPMPKVRRPSRRALVDEMVKAISDIEKNVGSGEEEA